MNARITFQVQITTLPAAEVIARMQAVNLTADVQAYQAAYLFNNDGTPMLTVCDDSTVENPAGSGTFERTVKLAYSAEFVAAFPTNADRSKVLSQFGIGMLRQQMRAIVTVSDADYSAADCP